MALGEIGEEPTDQPRVMLRAGLAEIGQAAHRPEPFDEVRRRGERHDVTVAGKHLQHGEVDRLRSRAHLAPHRPPLERFDQCPDAGEIQLALAPVEEFERLETMLLDPLDFFRAEFG